MCPFVSRGFISLSTLQIFRSACLLVRFADMQISVGDVELTRGLKSLVLTTTIILFSDCAFL